MDSEQSEQTKLNELVSLRRPVSPSAFHLDFLFWIGY